MRSILLLAFFLLNAGCQAVGVGSASGRHDAAPVSSPDSAADVTFAANEDAGRIPAWGPDAMPPQSDTAGIESPDLESACDRDPAPCEKKTGRVLEPEGFRILQGSHPYRTQEEAKLSDTLYPPLNTDGSPLLMNGHPYLSEKFLLQAAYKGEWWDLLFGPVIRIVRSRPGQSPEESVYKDGLIHYDRKEGLGSNCGFDGEYEVGDVISLYLYYEVDPRSTAWADYFLKPEGYNDAITETAFSSPEESKRFFADKKRVFFLGSFTVGLKGIQRRPAPLRSIIDGTTLSAGQEPPTIASLRSYQGLFRVQWETRDVHCAEEACWKTSDAPAGDIVRVVLTRNGQEIQYKDSLVTELQADQSNLTVELPLVRHEDVLSFYYFDSWDPPYLFSLAVAPVPSEDLWNKAGHGQYFLGSLKLSTRVQFINVAPAPPPPPPPEDAVLQLMP